MRKIYDAIGVVEVNFFANAVYIIDLMEKAAEVDLLMAEKYLGGRMVTLIIGGTNSQVSAAINSAVLAGQSMAKNPVRVAITISNPHEEIMKFIFNTPKEEKI